MKIITASKFYYHRAGLESYLFKITDLLRRHGHEVIPFSTQYHENYKTPYDDYFAEHIGIGGEEPLTLWKKWKAFTRIIYNREAGNKIVRLFNDTRPDVLWGFGIHRHLSPSIFMEAKKRDIPVIHRLSDYAIICPDSRLTKGDDSNCDGLLCPKKGYHHAIIHRCVRQADTHNGSKQPSLSASAVGALELGIHHSLRFYVNNVTKFIAPSHFLKNTMIQAGIPAEKLIHIPIFINTEQYTPSNENQGYLLYVGRLSREKGLPLLLTVMKQLSHIPLRIVGDGPQRIFLEQMAQGLKNVHFSGKLYGEELSKLVQASQAVVVPSTWYENSPNVILEAYAHGKPVIAAHIGGIPEYIRDGETGILYQHNSVEDLSRQINNLMSNSGRCAEMGRAARKLVETEYNPRNHLEQVMQLLTLVRGRK